MYFVIRTLIIARLEEGGDKSAMKKKEAKCLGGLYVNNGFQLHHS